MQLFETAIIAIHCRVANISRGLWRKYGWLC